MLVVHSQVSKESRNASRWLVPFVALFLLVGTLACDTLVGDGGDMPLVMVPADDAYVADTLKTQYESDAVRLALRFLEETEHPGLAEVEPPADIVQVFYDALVHVHNAEDIPERDTVVQVFDISTLPRPVLREVVVKPDEEAGWVDHWREGEAMTGVDEIDEWIESYDLKVKQFYEWSFGDHAVLRAERDLNIQALSAQLASHPDIEHAQPNNFIGDGNDIRARVEDGVYLDYSVAWGDCPAGCIYRRTWSFHVDQDGTVSFSGVEGPQAPATGNPW